MTTFETPDPITATVDVVLADVRVSARDVAATSVDVQPSDASNEEDVKAAELTRVEYANGQLLVRAPKLRSWLPCGTGGSIDVTIELPAGSALHASGQMADLHVDGRIGECRIRTGMGRIHVDEAATANLRAGAGDIVAGRLGGGADLITGAGDIRVGELAGAASVKNSNGATWIGVAHGDVKAKSANGDIAVDLAEAGVSAKTAHGDVRVGEAVRGSVALETRIGEVEVGVREGTAAWLDLNATTGRVTNELEAAGAPGEAEDAIEVRARTSMGDIVIRRAGRTAVAS